MEHAVYYERISAYVQLYGIGEFNTAAVKDRDRDLYNGITKRLGGFKRMRRLILEGTIHIPGYNLSEEEAPGETDSYKELTPEKEDTFVMVLKPLEHEMDEQTERKITSEAVKLKEIQPAKEAGLVKVITDLLVGQGEMMQLIGEMNSEIQSLRSDTRNYRSNVDLMHDKLKLIEDSYVENVREDCVAGIKRYAGLTSGKINGMTIQKAYSDMYAIFNERYGVNLYSIQATLIDDANRTRRQRGDRPINYIHPNKKGLRQIDIIERLGMIVEFYLIVKQAIEEYCMKNQLIARDFEEDKGIYESIGS